MIPSLTLALRAQTNFIVMSSDLVVDEKFLHGMADLHRLQDAMVTLLISRPKPVEGATGPVVDTKNEYGLMDYVGLKEDGERLLYFKAAADIENKMRISKKLLRKYVHVPSAGTRGPCRITHRCTVSSMSMYP